MNKGPDTFLRIALLPLDIIPGDKEANLAAVEKALAVLPPSTDIVVLPELFSTGYISDKDACRALAERNTCETVDRIKAWAAATGAAFAGSYLATTHPGIYNRAFFIEPSGEETFYDKHHLFGLGGEADLFHRGDTRPPVVRFRAWNISMIVCYDLRFPIWSRNEDGRYDVLLVPAAWPHARAYAWEHLLIARAIENQCYVVGANRSGTDKYGQYDNLAYIFDPQGVAVGIRPQDSPFIVADLDGRALTRYRRTFPVLADADSFTLD